MATIHPFPPRRAGLYDPLVDRLDPRELFDEAEFARRLRIFEARKKAALSGAGYRLTIGEKIVDALEGSFAAGFVLGFMAALVAVVAPFALGVLS